MNASNVLRNRIEELTNHGINLAGQGKLAEAADILKQAVDSDPADARARHNLGVALAQQDNPIGAIECLEQALELNSNYPEAHYNLANTLRDIGRRDEAIHHFRSALELRPDYPEALCNLGLALSEANRPGEAVVLLRHATRLRPDFSEAHTNLGLALAAMGRFDEAISSHERVLELDPRSAIGHSNLGNAYKESGRLEEALAEYDLSIRIDPSSVSTRWNRSLALLQIGDLERGWREYEWRWRRSRAKMRHFTQPRWDGSSLVGKTILLFCEQGLGDAIQFVRYAPLVRKAGGRIVLECPGLLKEIFETVPGVDCVISEGETLPDIDVQIPLMSLPAIFGTTLQTIPVDIPYISTFEFQNPIALLSEEASSLRIGIVWQGNPNHQWDSHRSVPLWRFAPVADIPGVRLITLQYGPGLDQLTNFRRFSVVDTRNDSLSNNPTMADTASLIANLDLVITVDTAVAHLAGAMGITVWVALSAIVDWRWLLERDDSPWYPSMRLFRQRKLGNWDDVFERIAIAVRGMLDSKRGQILQ